MSDQTTRNPQRWHATDDELGAYSASTASPVLAASVDAHLIGCEECRRSLGRISTLTDTERRWTALADAIDRPSPSLLERLGLLRAGRVRTAALASPALRWAWATALVVVLAVPLLAIATVGTGQRALAVLLAVAPLAPGAAVAIAYHRRSDPAGEIALATPSAGLRLLALRAVAVAAAAVPPGLLVGWLTGVAPHLALAWLLPGLALAALVLLAGTTRLDPLAAVAAVAGGWALAVLAPAPVRGLAARHVIDTVTSPAVQLLAVAVIAVSLLLTVARRDALAYRRTA